MLMFIAVFQVPLLEVKTNPVIVPVYMTWTPDTELQEPAIDRHSTPTAMPTVTPMPIITQAPDAPTVTPGASEVMPMPTASPAVTVDKELLRVVQLEAGYRYGYEAYLAIATVIFNRLDSGLYGSTIHAVVSAPNQFSVYHHRGSVTIDPTCYQACLDATLGKRSFPATIRYFRTVASYRKMTNKRDYSVYLQKWNTVFMSAK
jgi:spore germination cell wall hydrolase CwlJ-like protein